MQNRCAAHAQPRPHYAVAVMKNTIVVMGFYSGITHTLPLDY